MNGAIERLGPRSVVAISDLSDLPPGLCLVATPDEVVLTAAADTPGLDFALLKSSSTLTGPVLDPPLTAG